MYEQPATVPLLILSAMIALSFALPVVTPLTREALLYVASCPLELSAVEAVLGGTLEVVQLDADTCLLTNAEAREQRLGKNLEASQVWFERHTENGLGGDFIHGPVIFCRSEQIAHFNHLHAEVKPILSATERAARRRGLSMPVAQPSAEQLACSLANPEGCEMCGA